MGISKYITHLNTSRINHQSPFIVDDYFFCSAFERQHPPTANNMPGFSIFPAYCCNSSGNTAWNQPFKIGFQTAAQLHSFQQIECRVTNIQYLLIRSTRLLLFSVNTEWLSPLISAFVLFFFPSLPSCLVFIPFHISFLPFPPKSPRFTCTSQSILLLAPLSPILPLHPPTSSSSSLLLPSLY